MKIMINYDFFDKVRDAREPLGPLKVVRVLKDVYICSFPFTTAFALSTLNLLGSIVLSGLAAITSASALSIILKKCYKGDPIAFLAETDLTVLASKLKDLGIDTTYDLLLESELYTRKYNVKVNKNKIPYLLGHKYIMVPTYDYNGEIGATSILQEHVVGSKKYVLSIGSPQKQVQFAYSGA